MGLLIDGKENTDIHSIFWNAITKSSDALALSQLWVCGFNMTQLKTVADQISTHLHHYEYETNGKIDENNIFRPEKWGGINGGTANSIYLLAAGSSIVPDGINTSRTPMNQTGALKALITEGRLDPNATVITFLESNISLVDSLMRPWSILAGHRSLKDPNLRCDIEVFSLEKTGLYKPLSIRKSILYKNAVPINVDAEECNYSGDKVITRQVQFAYDRYKMHINKEMLPLDSTEDIINMILNSKNIKTNLNPSTISIAEVSSPGEVSVGEADITPDRLKQTTDINSESQRILIDVSDDQPTNMVSTVENPKVEFESDNVLQDVQNTLTTIQNNIQGVKGKINFASTKTSEALQEAGFNGLAMKVSNFNEKAQKVPASVVKFIGTGQKIFAATDVASFSIETLLGQSKVDSDKVAAAIRAAE